MKFYRNLGAISFESETQTLEIFTSSNSTSILQLKKEETPTTLIDQIANFYNHQYHLNNFTTYSEPQKGSAILISNSRQFNFKGVQTHLLCTLMLGAAKVIQNICAVVSDMVGDCSPHQFRLIGEKVIFVYVPLTRVEEQKKRSLIQVKSMIDLLREISNQKDVSQKLLLKKLNKSRNLSDLVEQIGYFSNVYCIGRTKIIDSRPTVKNPSKYLTLKPSKKLNLFKLDLPKSKKLQNSLLSHEGFSFTQHRHSIKAMHISISQTKTTHYSAHSTQQRTSFNSRSWGKESGFKGSRVSLNRSLIKEEKASKQKSVNGSSKKLKEALFTPVNSMDEEKLIQKLLKKKKQQSERIENAQISGVQTLIVEDHKELPEIRIQETIDTIERCKKREPKNQRQSKTSFQNVVHHKSQKEESPENLRSKKEVEKLPLKENEQILPKQTIDPKPQPLLNAKYVQSAISKQLKKRKIIQNEDLNDQIEVIEFAMPKEEKNHKQTKEDQYCSTLQNSWNKETYMRSSQQETKRVDNRLDCSQKLVQKCKDLNLMGSAVANTTHHLSKYEKIFWELPLFFIYRGFYLKRQQIGKQAEKLPERSKELNEIIEENSKIKESISKLIKTITKKMKKIDPKVLETLKPYLNLNQEVNCNEIMKNFIREYIQSLTQAAEQDESLTMHLVQISDAFLIDRGENVKESRRLQAMASESLGEYIIQQRKLLSKYL